MRIYNSTIKFYHCCANIGSAFVRKNPFGISNAVEVSGEVKLSSVDSNFFYMVL